MSFLGGIKNAVKKVGDAAEGAVEAAYSPFNKGSGEGPRPASLGNTTGGGFMDAAALEERERLNQELGLARAGAFGDYHLPNADYYVPGSWSSSDSNSTFTEQPAAAQPPQQHARQEPNRRPAPPPEPWAGMYRPMGYEQWAPIRPTDSFFAPNGGGGAKGGV